jgi:uncharacterized protein (DUF39 family)
MKTYEEINERIERKKAVVMTAEEIIGYVERKGVATAAREVDVVTTATFGPMCSSGCFLNFGHAKPRIRMSQAWIDDVEAYCGIAAVDVYLGATQLRRNDPANLYYPGEFRYGGGHVIERLVAGERLVMRTAEGPFPMETTYTWEAEAERRTRMTLRNRGEPAGFSKLFAPFMAAAMRRANRKDLARLKALLEAG